jgi:predicted enzyme related to lactoylglutathione lyase
MNKKATSGLLIFAKDINKLASFYTELLDAEITNRDDGYITLYQGGVEIIVHALPPQISDTIKLSVPPEVREESAIKPIFVVKSIEQCRQAAKQNGGSINGPDKEFEFLGYRYCDGVDAEGNVIQLREPQNG